MSEQVQPGFDSPAVVELMGHQRIAGRVREAVLGGCALLRVDVPPTPHSQAYTKYFGNGAIYALTPCSEEVALAAATEIQRYSSPIPVEFTRQLPAGSAAAAEAELEEDLADDAEDDTWR